MMKLVNAKHMKISKNPQLIHRIKRRNYYESWGDQVA